MPPPTRSRPRRDRRPNDPEERMRRAREAQEAAYQASRTVLERAAQRRDAEWRSALEANRRRTALFLSLSFLPAIVFLALGIVLPLFFAVGGVLALVWALLAAQAWQRSGAVPFPPQLLLEPARAITNGGVEPIDAARAEDVTEGLCAMLGLPVPAVRLLVDPAPNAVSFGRGPADATIVLTTGLLGALDRIQLEAVLAHELSHVKRRDVFTAGIASAPAARLADSLSGGRAGQWLLGADREIRADGSAVSVTRYPPALIDALEVGCRSNSAVPKAASELPALSRQSWLMGPGPESLAERLAVLYEL